MNKYDLILIAKQVMEQRGLQPEFSSQALQQLATFDSPAAPISKDADLRSLLWCSIDNDDSKDLDQLTYAEKMNHDETAIWIAIADVDALVHQQTAIDQHAQINTTSVYTPAKVFPMLPERLSTDLTSLNEGQDRVAMVVKMKIDSTGEIQEANLFPALVHNYAQLTYSGVGNWLAGGTIPEKIKLTPGLEKALICQHEAAQLLKQNRQLQGALTLESSEAEVKMTEREEIILALPRHNDAHHLIESFMIAANTAVARTLARAGVPSLMRIVRTPKRWDRIVAIAHHHGDTLPSTPDAKALDRFLVKRQQADPLTFPDLSLMIIKLLGRGEYIVEVPGEPSEGHFALALSQYTHSTAPNRRFPDLITQRQLKSYLNNSKPAYSVEELRLLADHCTQQEDAASKVERHLNKSAAALLLLSSIGTTYDGIVTGTGEKGTWVRTFDPPIEGKIIQGFQGLDVGDRVTVKLISVDVPKGYIDFISQP